MDESRLIAIEEKILHQENIIEELHQVVYRQQEEIDRLSKTLTQLIQRFQEAISEGPDVGPADDKPPHY